MLIVVFAQEEFFIKHTPKREPSPTFKAPPTLSGFIDRASILAT
jgi:hypothetical protein